MPKVWLITGSSRGFGAALADAVLTAGDSLIATARHPQTLAPLVHRYGNQVRTIALDVTAPQDAANAVESALGSFGRLDVLVNNAGYANIAAIEDARLEDFRAELETNLFGVINVTKAVIPTMREQRAGHIIQISSIAARTPSPGRGPYATAKWGVEGFSEVLAKELSPLGIHVTIVEPGGFRTDFARGWEGIREWHPDYDSTVGRMARFQRDYDGAQPGDPAKAAAAILHVATLKQPPLRLLLGSDAVRIADQANQQRIDSDRQWRELSLTTDFE